MKDKKAVGDCHSSSALTNVKELPRIPKGPNMAGKGPIVPKIVPLRKVETNLADPSEPHAHQAAATRPNTQNLAQLSAPAAPSAVSQVYRTVPLRNPSQYGNPYSLSALQNPQRREQTSGHPATPLTPPQILHADSSSPLDKNLSSPLGRYAQQSSQPVHMAQQVQHAQHQPLPVSHQLSILPAWPVENTTNNTMPQAPAGTIVEPRRKRQTQEIQRDPTGLVHGGERSPPWKTQSENGPGQDRPKCRIVS